MHFTTIAAALALMASAAQAFVIPPETSNGVYSVSVAPDGTEVHAKLSEREVTEMAMERRSGMSPDPATSVLKKLETRQNGRIWCGCGFNMNSGNCDAAVQALKDQLRPGQINPGMAFYSIRGDGGQRVVAFACNRDPGYAWILTSSQYGDSLARITGSCGLYIAGATEFGDPGRALIMGYARYADGDDFCAGSTSSPANRC